MSLLFLWLWLQDVFGLSFLGALLIGGPATPMYKALIASNIGSDFSPGSGFDHHTKETTFSVGLQGIAAGDADKVQRIVQETLERAAKEGFEQAQVDSILHQVSLTD